MTTEARELLPSRSSVPSVRRVYGKIPEIIAVPNLIQIQLDSFNWFIGGKDPESRRESGLRELFDEISPIVDFTGTRMELRFLDYEFGEPKYSEAECREKDMTYAAPLRVDVELRVRETEEIKEQTLFMGDFPLMTKNGTFIINGAERVVVSQLVRSPGVYFTIDQDPVSGRNLGGAKLIPNRGAWLEFETSNRDIISVKVDRKRKIPVTTLLRAIDQDEEIDDETKLGTDERILRLFEDVENLSDVRHFIRTTLERDNVHNKRQALEDFYKKLRPGDPPTLENARALVKSLFFDPRRYDLGRVGRYKVNKRLGLDIPRQTRTLTQRDLIEIIKQIVRINFGMGSADDIDHLGNRRVRAVGELIQNQFRVGLSRMERVVRERMSITDPDQATPSALINIRPVVAAMKEFFGGSQLSQFMDQTNPLAELTHKRRLSALGPGGLSRDRAGFDVRDVHHSHYGRICPIETPEGPNIGLIGSLATFGKVNEYGFIETPYRRVLKELPANSPDLVGRYLREDVRTGGEVLATAGTYIDAALAEKIAASGVDKVKLRPFVVDAVEYLSADTEDNYVVAQANVALDERGNFLDSTVEVRHRGDFRVEPVDRVDYMDVSPKQIVSVATSLIPFLEHDDANRALMGSNMQRQAVPLLRPEVPLIGTGMEKQTAQDSGQVILARKDGHVLSATADRIVIKYDDGEVEEFALQKFVRSNQGTCINQRPIVARGDRVTAGQAIADSSSTDQGELALGQSVLCAFMSWEGYNFEDAIIISENLVREDKFTSIHIEKHEIEARDTKLGPEEITRDIPNVGEESLRDLDENGVIRIGAEVREGDILVGKITPKGETELTAEEKLLRAIFGEKAREVKDTSLRVPHGERGKVIDVKVFDRDSHLELPAGVNKLVRVSIAQKRKLSEGDKMAGRHGNKGVVSRIVAPEDMPYLADGRPVDIILNPIGVPSRMNLGQVLETHLGWAAKTLGFRAITPVFDGAKDEQIEDALARAWLALQAGAVLDEDAIAVREANLQRNPEIPEYLDVATMRAWLAECGYDPDQVLSDEYPGAAKRACLELWLAQQGEENVRGKPIEELEHRAERLSVERRLAPPVFGKQILYDGRTGEPFDQPVTVGYIYMLKLIHLVEDKIHARSTGPYSLITQQPLGGKAQFGGQRFGEMEVWALEAYGAAHILQELLTVKSDDVVGRVKTYEAIVKGENVLEPGVPESFKVLVKELQSLGLAVEVLNEDDEYVSLRAEDQPEEPRLGINLSRPERGDVFFDEPL
jgi:DNA-directed RNA polymerase subunit beta